MNTIVIIVGGVESLTFEKVRELKNHFGEDLTVLSPEEAKDLHLTFRSNVIVLGDLPVDKYEFRNIRKNVCEPYVNYENEKNSKHQRQQNKLRAKFHKR